MKKSLAGIVAGLFSLGCSLGDDITPDATKSASGESATPTLTIYSARNYPSDLEIFEQFERSTGLRIERVVARRDEMIDAIRSRRGQPPDVIITNDSGALQEAAAAGLLAATDSAVLERRIPAHLRHPEGLWYGLSMRVRTIFYDREGVPEGAVSSMLDLADPRWRGRVCMRTSEATYQRSTLAWMIHRHGIEEATRWARGVARNLAREPEGGDYEQLKAVLDGDCALTVANLNYFTWMVAEDDTVTDAQARIGVVFPDQGDGGSYVNVSAAGVARAASDPEAALAFIEFMTEEFAQSRFAAGHDEYPLVEGVAPIERLSSLGSFEASDAPLARVAQFNEEARRILREVGWK